MDDVIHTAEYQVRTTWTRMNSLAWTYAEIAETALGRFLTGQRNPVVDPGSDGDPEEYFGYKKRITEAAIQTIVFSAMGCESAIYDLAAIHLTDSYAESIIDKLDVIGKWVVVPQLICGKPLKPDGPALNALRTLIPARNLLVHNKSHPGLFDLTNIEDVERRLHRAKRDSDRLIANVVPAYQAVVLLSLELNRVLKTPSGVLPFFEKGTISSKNEHRTQEVMEFLGRCREIDAKHFRKNEAS
ncbi:hypothetical protein [Pandoraea anhela]|uniref:Uncharacterized protein n=1 Tax=Pandoraea anhela TaxID=2508295 RepID=A0A5E4UJ10_9BURK|nr:hypothetical protein [Pandoraea anhela]VVD99643.1 hypothetical protein PAN31108_02063 [Pandoraea anhela]